MGTAISNRPMNRLKPAVSDSSSSSRSNRLAENREIVVRDKNGGYKLDMPTLPGNALVNEEGEELNENETEETELGFESSESETKKEKFEAALVDMMIRHRNRQSSGEPDEILDIVHQSLLKKANSLNDDNWMFEVEREVRM
ncbi:hypothetical protein N7468_001895 [Penicillium chermesinum]|uniref:Uncharacterized protein n=1 Tax=Penicillium chermesinum TaxID=63820 RepID=A0A9W9PKD4_9EURO|nr:uncharacterized protein N7468_001895 [Penicillium chermesinum]KAJ5246912.1 hypothetical protein N7468_001895 [Penicillium chermesinum]